MPVATRQLVHVDTCQLLDAEEKNQPLPDGLDSRLPMYLCIGRPERKVPWQLSGVSAIAGVNKVG